MNMNNNENLKEFKIPVTWEVYGTVTVFAKDVESAMKTAKEIEKNEGLPLPTESEYVDGSFEINEDIGLIELLNKDIL